MKLARLLVLLLLLGCERRDLTVFDVAVSAPPSGSHSGGSTPSSETGGGGTGGSATAAEGGSAGAMDLTPDGGEPSFPGQRPCAEDFDCDTGWVCEKPGCDAPFGQCVPWPSLCWDDPMPVCGCDGVTYWNDCVRLKSPSHPQLASFGQCRDTAFPCQFGADCNVPYASCSHLMAPGELCGHGTGSCWVLPAQCVPSADKKRWRECRPPDQGPGPCSDMCNAIASERPHAELRRYETCN